MKTISMRTALPVLAMLFFSTAASAIESPAHPDFIKLDNNRDGRISWAEYAAHNPVSGRLNPRRIFDNVDKNLDGYISRGEFDMMKKRQGNNRYSH